MKKLFNAENKSKCKKSIKEYFNNSKKGFIMPEFKKYRKSGITEMIPYIPGEVFPAGIALNPLDDISKDGMIARNPENHDDMWFVSQEYFDKNYVEA